MSSATSSTKAKAPESSRWIRAHVKQCLAGTRTDFHTHLYDPAMKDASGKPLLYTTLPQLLCYHYHLPETLRYRRDLSVETFMSLPAEEAAPIIWHECFELRSPLSEAGQMVVAALRGVGVDIYPGQPYEQALDAYDRVASRPDFVEFVFRKANIDRVFMTNDPLDANERPNWENGFTPGRRFGTALRLDSLMVGAKAERLGCLRELGFDVDPKAPGIPVSEATRYCEHWIDRMKPAYIALSLPPEWALPRTADNFTGSMVRDVALPIADKHGLPISLMIGVRRQVNPSLKLAGDSCGLISPESIATLEEIIRKYPKLRFYITILHPENQADLCVLARKFPQQVIPFGTWWFSLNDPTYESMFRNRLSMLGTSFIPWHSDCRHLLHLVGKRVRFDEMMTAVLTEKYEDLWRRGWKTPKELIASDIDAFLKYGHV